MADPQMLWTPHRKDVHGILLPDRSSDAWKGKAVTQYEAALKCGGI